MITLQQSDFRNIELPKDKKILSVTDPPYNIKFKYGVCKDNLSEKEYIGMLSKIPKPCVIIHYPEETIKYVIPALGNPEKVLMWCYNSHLPRAVRMVSFFGIKPDLSKYKIPYRNPTDKRVKKLIENGSQGTSIKEWFIIEQVKNVSKEYQGYANQIPEELIRVILSLCEGHFDVVFDPFCGSGTTLAVGIEKGYDVIGTDIDENAIYISKKRLEVKADGTTTDGIPPKPKGIGYPCYDYMTIPLPKLSCPLCGIRMDIESWKNDHSYFEAICRRDLMNVRLSRMTDEEVMELASE